MAHDLVPVIVALTAWGERWIRKGPIDYVHGADEHEVGHPLWCASCDSSVEPADVHVRVRTSR